MLLSVNFLKKDVQHSRFIIIHIVPWINSTVLLSEQLTAFVQILIILLPIGTDNSAPLMVNKYICAKHVAVTQTAVYEGNIIISKIVIKSIICFIKFTQRCTNHANGWNQAQSVIPFGRVRSIKQCRLSLHIGKIGILDICPLSIGHII